VPMSCPFCAQFAARPIEGKLDLTLGPRAQILACSIINELEKIADLKAGRE